MHGHGLCSALVLAVAMVALSASSPGGAVSAQASNPCALLTADEIQRLAGNASIGEGVSIGVPASSYATCRYAWGVGTRRFTLGVVVYEASQRFHGMSPDQIRQRLVDSIKPGTDEAIVPNVGEAAVFTFESPYYSSATALLKGRIVQVHLDGLAALEKKDEAIALLTAAVSRL